MQQQRKRLLWTAVFKALIGRKEIAAFLGFPEAAGLLPSEVRQPGSADSWV